MYILATRETCVPKSFNFHVSYTLIRKINNFHNKKHWGAEHSPHHRKLKLISRANILRFLDF